MVTLPPSGAARSCQDSERERRSASISPFVHRFCSGRETAPEFARFCPNHISMALATLTDSLDSTFGYGKQCCSRLRVTSIFAAERNSQLRQCHGANATDYTIREDYSGPPCDILWTVSHSVQKAERLAFYPEPRNQSPNKAPTREVEFFLNSHHAGRRDRRPNFVRPVCPTL